MSIDLFKAETQATCSGEEIDSDGVWSCGYPDTEGQVNWPQVTRENIMPLIEKSGSSFL
jgi:hypothetical protein